MRPAAIFLVALWPALAHGYTLSSPITTGCHEQVTSAALRQVRVDLGVAPLPAGRDDQALIGDLPFSLETDMRDLAAVSLLLSVRDNDLKGNDITNTVDLIQVHGNPAAQREHCLRAPGDDEPTGSMQALSDCRTFIHDTALAAVDGLDAAGKPDASKVTSLTVSLAIRGRIDVPLATFYVRAGQAMHALQDAFTHTFRTADASRVTTVLNWVDFAEERLDESRDGPAHVSALDACENLDAMRTLRLQLAQQASIDLLHAVLDPGRSLDQKAADIDAVLDGSLGTQQGCTFYNHWCDAPEQALADPTGCGCHMVAPNLTVSGLIGMALLALLARIRLRRPLRRTTIALLILLGHLTQGGALRADEPDPDDVPLTPVEIAWLHLTKTPGPRLGIAAAMAASLDRTAVAGSVAGRFRVSSRWLVGADLEWNPWITTHPGLVRAGVFNAYATLIRRFPMRLERVNLRTSMHAGVSVLLFDLYGARQGSFGPYVGIAPLGIDVDLGHFWKLVVDPLDLEIPIPHVTGVPLYYEQFRLMVGFQYGA